MMESWKRAETGSQRANFYQRKLGIPFVDKDLQPVSMSHCLACAREGVAAGLTWQSSSREPTVLGCDQMGSFLVLVVMKRLRNGAQGVIHVEAVYGHDVFDRIAEVMLAYNVEIACLEQLPNVNDSRRLANDDRFRGKVFLVHYSPSPGADLVSWSDAFSRSDAKTEVSMRSRYVAVAQQYKAMQASLFRVRNMTTLFPDPSMLSQDVIDRGEWRRINICRDWLFEDLTRVGLIVEEDPETRRQMPKVIKLGADPHFAFALLLANLAFIRVHGGSTMILPEGSGQEGRLPAPLAETFARAMPGISPMLLGLLVDPPLTTCSSCVDFKPGSNGIGTCTVRNLQTASGETSCMLYVRGGANG
jgi:hypothetical protein